MNPYLTWLVNSVSLAALLLVAVGTVAYVVLDPYGVSGLAWEGNRHRIRTSYELSPYVIARQLEKESSILVFGNSRSGRLDSRHLGGPVINFSNSVYDNPIDILAFLESLAPRARENIRQIYILVPEQLPFRQSVFEGKKATLFTLAKTMLYSVDFKLFRHGLETLALNLTEQGETEYYNRFKANGAAMAYNEPLYLTSEKEYQEAPPVVYQLVEEALEAYNKIRVLSNDEGIETHFFLPPLNALRAGKIDWPRYRAFLDKFLGSGIVLHDLTLMEPISFHVRYASDFGHLNTEIGLVRQGTCLIVPSCLMGYRLEKDGVGEHVEAIRQKAMSLDYAQFTEGNL